MDGSRGWGSPANPLNVSLSCSMPTDGPPYSGAPAFSNRTEHTTTSNFLIRPCWNSCYTYGWKVEFKLNNTTLRQKAKPGEKDPVLQQNQQTIFTVVQTCISVTTFTRTSILFVFKAFV